MTEDARRGRRYAFPAAILALTFTGVTAIGCGALEKPATPVVAGSAPGNVASASRALTTGPLMPTSPPARLSIPALKVAVPVIGLGLQEDGAMQVPSDATTVGWYTKAPTPGALGPAVLAGHVDYKKRPGTFAHLDDLKAGDAVDIVREDGSMAMFTVSKTERYAKDKFPSDAVYGPIDHAGLRLITCGGDFDSAKGHYVDNIVVYATLTRSHGLPEPVSGSAPAGTS